MSEPQTLRRALGKWDLTAIGVNQVIGSAIFLLPAQVAAQIGPWGPLAFMAVGLLSLRGRLDDVVRARHQPRVGGERPDDARARVLLAGAQGGIPTGGDDHW